jgi:predicted methyltransferase
MEFRVHKQLASLTAATMLLVVASLPAAAKQTRTGDGNAGMPPRDAWQRVPEILAALGAAPGQRIADIAAGTGYLTSPLSRQVGRTGRIYAVEIGETELRALRALAQHDSLRNIEVVAGTPTDPRLPDNLDAAVILNSYHELTDYKAMLAAIKHALRPGGLLVLVDNAAMAGWFTERSDQASHHALDPKYVDAELCAAGFEIVDRRDNFIVQPYAQWLIVARPVARSEDSRTAAGTSDRCADTPASRPTPATSTAARSDRGLARTRPTG